MTHDAHGDTDRVLAHLANHAAQIAALPEAQRESRYEALHRAFFEAAMKGGDSALSARKFAAVSVNAVRAAVCVIDSE